MRRAGPGKTDTESQGLAVSSSRAGLPFRDGFLRTLKVGDALNIYPWTLPHQNLKGLAVPSVIINCWIVETQWFWERPREAIAIIGWRLEPRAAAAYQVG